MASSLSDMRGWVLSDWASASVDRRRDSHEARLSPALSAVISWRGLARSNSRLIRVNPSDAAWSLAPRNTIVL